MLLNKDDQVEIAYPHARRDLDERDVQLAKGLRGWVKLVHPFKYVIVDFDTVLVPFAVDTEFLQLIQTETETKEKEEPLTNSSPSSVIEQL